MNKDNKAIVIMAICVTIAFALCLVFCAFAMSNNKKSSLEPNVVYEKEYVYVNLPYNTSSTNTDAPAEEAWIVKEYYEQIGIFTEDGTLIRIIEIYTKTLPETDRRLLKEGIKVTSEQRLNALIEDYTS